MHVQAFKDYLTGRSRRLLLGSHDRRLNGETVAGCTGDEEREFKTGCLDYRSGNGENGVNGRKTAVETQGSISSSEQPYYE